MNRAFRWILPLAVVAAASGCPSAQVVTFEPTSPAAPPPATLSSPATPSTTPGETGPKRSVLLPNVIASEPDYHWPVRGRVTAGYNALVDGFRNDGVDIAAPAGTEVRAAKSGVVSFVHDELRGLGKTVIIDHGSGASTLYGYNGEVLVRQGDRVQQGQAVAKVGRTGRAKTAGCHFVIFNSGRTVDPMNYLK
jgi:murein DD-endopeptidase MepM/ murein hydrolase activator NlpD